MHARAFLIGLVSSLFFSFTFLLNRSMALEGGSPLWTSSLRFLFLFPILLVYLLPSGKLKEAHRTLRRNPGPWFLWSAVGFWVFYFFLCLGSTHGNAWLVAGAWQITIVAGILLTPLFGHRIPRRNLVCACVIFVGVLLLQAPAALTGRVEEALACILPITLAAVAYPLGNRKLMALPHGLNTLQRIYLMTLCTLPVWLAQAAYALLTVGPPARGTLVQSLLVALFSGFLATFLFFYATDLSKDSPKALAITESTIAGEILFTLIGGILFLQDPLPNAWGWAGLLLILLGMCCNR